MKNQRACVLLLLLAATAANNAAPPNSNVHENTFADDEDSGQYGRARRDGGHDDDALVVLCYNVAHDLFKYGRGTFFSFELCPFLEQGEAEMPVEMQLELQSIREQFSGFCDYSFSTLVRFHLANCCTLFQKLDANGSGSGSGDGADGDDVENEIDIWY